MSHTTPFCKSTICGHEPRQHGRDQLTRIADWPFRFSLKGRSVSKQIAMYDRRQFDRQFHRLVIGNGTELELCHLHPLTFVRLKHKVAVDDHAHRKPRSDRQCRLDVKIALNDLLSSLVQAIAGSTSER